MNIGEINLSEKKQIIILISTYNGEEYLDEQLKSIYDQTYTNFAVYVRDDGSQDLTKDILNRYEKKYDNFQWFSGRNIGTSKSFFSLMKMIPLEDAIYVFSDQDDVWLPYKLQHIYHVFETDHNSKPLLYCGDTILADQELHILKKENFGENICPSFGNALVENICIGCTSAMNRCLLENLVKRIPQNEVMHDWWFYLTASCFGTVIYDKEPLLYYRQHSRNVMGSGITKYDRIIRRLRNHKNHKHQISKQTREFSDTFQVTGENAYLIECIKQYKESLTACWRLITNTSIHRQRRLDDLIFKILFLFKQL